MQVKSNKSQIQLKYDEKYEIVNEYIKSKQYKQVIKFLIDKFDEEEIFTIFDKFFFESPDSCLNLCKEGILLNNAIAHHKYALILIFNPKATKSSLEKLLCI